MRVVAVVLNWRRPDETIACVASIRRTAPDVDVVVVDNASEDGSVDRIAAACPGARLVVTSENLGYAGGNNAGIAAALEDGAEAVLVLNNDVELRDGCVQALADAARAQPDAGILAPLSLRAGDPSTLDFFRARVDLRNVALLAEGRDEPRATVFADEPIATDYATGSALWLDAGMLERVGPFDERYFLVWEDVDLSLRAQRAGRRVLVVPRSEVLHAGSTSFGGGGSPLYQYCFVRNSFLFVRSYVRWPARPRTLRMIERRYRNWVEQAHRDEPAVAGAIERGIEDGLAQRYGRPPDELMPDRRAG